jgi:CBS domain-containing protein
MSTSATNIMSKKLITISAGASMIDAYQLMKERRLRHLVVTDRVEKVVGILSDRDVRHAISPEVSLKYTENVPFGFRPGAKVEEFMSGSVRSIAWDRNVQDAAEMMSNEKISALLVLSADSNPCGIITTDDLLRLLNSILTSQDRQQPNMLDLLSQQDHSDRGYLD